MKVSARSLFMTEEKSEFAVFKEPGFLIALALVVGLISGIGIFLTYVM
jgi:hypothetical protein